MLRAADRFRVCSTLAVVSFVIYACTIFALPQDRDGRYCCEQSSFAAAVSAVAYGAPLGTFYRGVFDYFVAHPATPLEELLADVQADPGVRAGIQPVGLVKTTFDGNGVGYPVLATMAFRLFGLHAWALIETMLLLMAFSMLAFLRRFPDRLAGVVVLYFASLTAMLFTEILWDPIYFAQMHVGAIRYFSLVSILPAFHIMLDILDPNAPAVEAAGERWAPLAVQSAIFAISALVRGSVLSIFGAITVLLLALAWKRRRDTARLRDLIRQTAVIGLVGASLLAAVVVVVPKEYLTQGRFGTVIWHRITGSLTVNPTWPFPSINEMFPCPKYIPEGILSGSPDRNGHCMWWAYILAHKIQFDTLDKLIYGEGYETALREAFFQIARRYPRQVLETFLYYKPPLILSSLIIGLRTNFAGDPARLDPVSAITKPGVYVYPHRAIALLAASLAVLAAWAVYSAAGWGREVGWVAFVACLTAIFSVPPYIAVWASPTTVGDLLLLSIFLAGLALSAVPAALWWAVHQLSLRRAAG